MIMARLLYENTKKKKRIIIHIQHRKISILCLLLYGECMLNVAEYVKENVRKIKGKVEV